MLRFSSFLPPAVLLLACTLLTSCKTNEVKGPLFLLDFYMESSPNYPDRFVGTAKLPLSEVEITVDARPFLNHYSVDRVELVQVELGLAMLFQFDRQGALALYQSTLNNRGKRLVITVNGAPVGVRRIDVPISDGVLMAFMELSEEEIHQMALDLQDTTAKLEQEEAKNSHIERQRRKTSKSATSDSLQ